MLQEVRIKTPNNTGVAARSPLVGNYGMHYDPDKVRGDLDEGPSKKFKGKLDLWLEKTAEKDQVLVLVWGVRSFACVCFCFGVCVCVCVCVCVWFVVTFVCVFAGLSVWLLVCLSVLFVCLFAAVCDALRDNASHIFANELHGTDEASPIVANVSIRIPLPSLVILTFALGAGARVPSEDGRSRQR